MGDLKVYTIVGYKSAIVATLKGRGVNVGADPYICGLASRGLLSMWTDW